VARGGEEELMAGRNLVGSTENPLVSVLLLCFRHEQFVAEAIDGLLGQTYSPLEILIFDDCSPDKTVDVITRKLAGRKTRHEVSFARNCRNMSAPATRRLALKRMRGDIFFLSHGDDIMRPEMIEEMVRELRRSNVSLVTANAEYIDERSRPLFRTFRDLTGPADDTLETLARDGSNACCFGAAIGFDREVYDKFGFDTEILGTYDIIFPFYAYLFKGAKFFNKVLLKYRVHSGNASLSLAAEKAEGLAQLEVQERTYLCHLANALRMEEVLTQLRAQDPARYEPVAQRILPLVQTQLMRTKRDAYWAKSAQCVNSADVLDTTE
jgi:glycosyltransferase involved in cell wall biosynthesis